LVDEAGKAPLYLGNEVGIEVALVEGEGALEHIDGLDVLLELEQREHGVGVALDVVINLGVLGVEYLYAVDFDDDGGVLEVRGVHEELVVAVEEFLGGGELEIYFPAELQVE
jgi:hypothetical protein